MPGTPWNDATTSRLLLAIIHLTAPKLPNWQDVANLMGEGFTAESTRQRFQKIRKESATTFGELGPEVPGTPAKGTPAKGTPRARKPKGEGQTPSKGSRKRKAPEEFGDGREDDKVQNGEKEVKAEKEDEQWGGEFDFETA